MSRRRGSFIAIAVALGVLGTVMIWRFASPVVPARERVLVVGPVGAFERGSVSTFLLSDDTGLAVVESRPWRQIVANKLRGCPPENVTGVAFHLVRSDDGSFQAFSARSPHLGEFVHWVRDYEFAGRRGWFVEPCHVDTYDMDGGPVFGPAPRALDRYGVTVRQDAVEVDLRELARGASRSLTPDDEVSPRATVTPRATAGPR